MTPFLTQRLQHAIALAVKVHDKMIRKGDGQFFITHPIAVFGLLVRFGADEDTCIAGLLHDTIEDSANEDQAALRATIREQFGSKVLETVEGVTEQDKSLPWKERKKHYLEHLETASQESLLVSCADMTHNISCLAAGYEREGEKFWERFNANKQWKVWFIDARRDILVQRLPKEYTEELHSHLERLNGLLSRPLPPGYGAIGVSKEGDGEALIISDPLFQSFWNHCMLTEEEMETGMLDDTRQALERAGEEQP